MGITERALFGLSVLRRLGSNKENSSLSGDSDYDFDFIPPEEEVVLPVVDSAGEYNYAVSDPDVSLVVVKKGSKIPLEPGLYVKTNITSEQWSNLDTRSRIGELATKQLLREGLLAIDQNYGLKRERYVKKRAGGIVLKVSFLD